MMHLPTLLAANVQIFTNADKLLGNAFVIMI